MILVTVGANPHPFDRLIEAVDKLVESGRIREKIFIQLGNSEYIPKHVKTFKRFLKDNEHKKLMKKADLIITHAGSGNIVTGLSYKKPMIIVPRRKKYGEHVDDHQLDLARHLEKRDDCRVLYDLKDLGSVIKQFRKKKVKSKKKEESKILEIIRDYVESELKY